MQSRRGPFTRGGRRTPATQRAARHDQWGCNRVDISSVRQHQIAVSSDRHASAERIKRATALQVAVKLHVSSGCLQGQRWRRSHRREARSRRVDMEPNHPAAGACKLRISRLSTAFRFAQIFPSPRHLVLTPRVSLARCTTRESATRASALGRGFALPTASNACHRGHAGRFVAPFIGSPDRDFAETASYARRRALPREGSSVLRDAE